MRLFGLDIVRRTKELAGPGGGGGEFGHSGTSNYDGIITSIDYNKDWEAGYGSPKWGIIDEMRRSDGQVKGTLKYCKEPVSAASWVVEPASDSPADREIAEYVEWNLMDGLTHSWRYVLSHFLLALDFGCMVFEKVWALDPETGRYYCKKIAPRMPWTVLKWNLKNDQLDSIEQMVPSIETKPIPISKAILFTIDQEGDNFEGVSILRSAYKHWKMKLAFEKISAMSYDRYGMGIPIFKEPADASKEDKERADKIGENLRSHENAWVRLPFGWDLDIKFGQGWESPDAQIRYHNEMISAGIMQQFVNLGTMDRGSRAVGEVLQDPYYLSLQALAESICETLNKQLIRELVDYNWEVDEYPTLKAEGLKGKDWQSVCTALAALANPGFVTYTLDTENAVRRMMGIPELDEADLPAASAPKQQDPEQEPDQAIEQVPGEEEGQQQALAEGRTFRRELSENELFVEFAEIDNQINERRDRLVSKIGDIRKGQAKLLARDLVPMIRAGRVDPNKVKVKHWGKMADVVKQEMRSAHEYGGLTVRDELRKQKAVEILKKRESGKRALSNLEALVELSDDDLQAATLLLESRRSKKKIVRKTPSFDKLVDNRADAIVNASNDQLRRAGIAEANSIIKSGATLVNAEIEERLFEQFMELKMRGVAMECIGAITEGLSEGRADFVSAAADEFARAIRSGVLDNNICSECEPEDGQEYEVSEAVEMDFPDPNCAGDPQCRCMMVYVSKEEEEATVKDY